MKRSRQVPASLVVALASGVSVTGCSSERTYTDCVDAYGNIVSDYYCRGGGGGYVGGHYIGGSYHYTTRTVHYGGFGGSGGGGGGFFGG